MSEEVAAPAGPKGPKTTQSPKAKLSRKTLKKRFRTALKAKILTDREFSAKYFEGKSKRKNDRKVAFRKRHETKKGAGAAA